MSGVQMDPLLFQQRIKNLIKYWENAPSAFNDAEALLIPAGQSSDETVYQKGTALQTWLLLYEFPDTNLLITKSKVYVLASSKKANLIFELNNVKSMVDRKMEIECFRRSKDAEESRKSIESFLAVVKKFKKVGVFQKDKLSGKWIDEWNAVYSSLKSELEEVDVSGAVATVLAVKDENEVKISRQAGKVSSLIVKNYFVEEMAALIDEEKDITHEKFASKVENVLFDEKAKRKLSIPSDINQDFLDFCYTPIIQSGGSYDLKPSAVSNGDKLHAGTILCSLGVRYRNYCSTVGRTYLIDPNKKQEENYEFLLTLQKYLVESLSDGVTGGQIYEKALSYVQENKPELVQHFVKNLGFVTGLEYRESSYVLNAKNSNEIYENMTINLILGFQGIPNRNADDERGKVYSLLVADTIVVGKNGSGFLTDAPRDFRMVSFFFKDDVEKVEEVRAAPTRSSKSTILKTKLRAENRGEEDMMAEQRRREHQRTLLTDRVEDGMARYSAGEGGAGGERKKAFRKYESYKKDSLLPKEIKACRIVIDKRNDTILLPILGIAVPFHMNTIKNISKSEEGEFVHLRFNFNTPAQIAKKDETLPYDDPTATFIRSLSFRSADTARYNDLYRQITDLRKEILKKENERRLKADLVEQDSLQESKRPLAILSDVSIRPGLEGKKLPGDVQVHNNGLRYQPVRGDQKVDVLFSNIKHLFFQPCDHELFVILHCHLKNPIMVGKKKTKDVQFYRDVSEGGFDETNNRKNRRQFYNDEDELMAEQEERRRKQKMNKEFKMFAEKISEVSGYLEADVPIRELGFSGVPARTNVLMQPTTECLVHLTDPPFSVITLADVEIAYLERVQFHLKNFDLVFVLKDFALAPLHINTIPMKQLEPIKEWLDSVDIPFIEGPFNLNWANIMKNINQDPAGFYEDGGWTNIVGGGEGDSGDEDDEESVSEYNASTSESDDDVSEEEESEFSEEDDEEGSDEDFDEEESEGEDWDELERKAKHADGSRGQSSSKGKRQESDDDLRPKKKRK